MHVCLDGEYPKYSQTEAETAGENQQSMSKENRNR